MGSVGVRDLRDNLSEYLRRVREGELLVITDRGKPIGELAPTGEGRSVELRGFDALHLASYLAVRREFPGEDVRFSSADLALEQAARRVGRGRRRR